MPVHQFFHHVQHEGKQISKTTWFIVCIVSLPGFSDKWHPNLPLGFGYIPSCQTVSKNATEMCR